MRLTAAELMMATVRAQVMFSLFSDFEEMSRFTPDPRHKDSIQTVFDQVIEWSNALKPLRN